MNTIYAGYNSPETAQVAYSVVLHAENETTFYRIFALDVPVHD